jgi:hypothetical protein
MCKNEQHWMYLGFIYSESVWIDYGLLTKEHLHAFATRVSFKDNSNRINKIKEVKCQLADARNKVFELEDELRRLQRISYSPA